MSGEYYCKKCNSKLKILNSPIKINSSGDERQSMKCTNCGQNYQLKFNPQEGGEIRNN